ncbi:peroxisome biogenesis factor 2-like [Clavelina lepadiformis]|uniref:RING-type E3 ubiquitin transferase (cysteine targeting) n=1 Tax=Clavelina lepadiformis TaxID=159417 RepID=A0ABP0EZB3_CLALP
MMDNKSPIPALRVAQLDTNELDESVIKLMSDQLHVCCKYKIWKFDLLRVEPHLRAALYGILLYETLWKKQQSIGQRLLGLRYGDSVTLSPPSKFKSSLLHIALLLEYWLKATNNAETSFVLKHRHLLTLSKLISGTIKLFALLNFLLFLRRGFFHKILLRLLGLRTIYADPNPRERNITFQTMSRELLWHGFAETGVFFLSLVNVRKFQQRMTRFFLGTASDPAKLVDMCAFCQSIPTMPYSCDCNNHIFCYYCVASLLKVDADARCPSCNDPIGCIRPLDVGKVLIET